MITNYSGNKTLEMLISVLGVTVLSLTAVAVPLAHHGLARCVDLQGNHAGRGQVRGRRQDVGAVGRGFPVRSLVVLIKFKLLRLKVKE